MASRNLEAKHDKILKALLRLPDNRKCAVCDTLVGQADPPEFSTFLGTLHSSGAVRRSHVYCRVHNTSWLISAPLFAQTAAAFSTSPPISLHKQSCTYKRHERGVISKSVLGCSRQFNHRTKGVSMATFKPEEIRALEEGGNGVCPLS